ncbi:MAG: hypothetical protein HYU80_04370 [Candidatus Blackburnbacteria bacterium]|nr:hypothetical protein [Candidatus Blackburnbacteria bacterium]
MQSFSKSPKTKIYNPFEEPSQIVKTATEQLSGANVKPSMEAQQPLSVKEQAIPEEITEARSRARLRELREEVSQITEEREKQEIVGRQEEEYAQKKQEEATRIQPAPEEPQGKRPKGMLRGFAGFLKRKQTHTELGKNPAQ